MRILSIGPLPPEWGGPKPGGVATHHRSLIEELAGHNVTVLSWSPSDQVETVRPDRSDPEGWYLREAGRADLVVMHHVAHNWAAIHARHRPAPAVGIVHSWTPVLNDPTKRAATEAGLDGMDVLVFPSAHSRDQGETLGFTYQPPATVIPHGLASQFEQVEPRARRGVVFVGRPGDIKRPWLAEEACRTLEVPFTIIADRGQHEVVEALAGADALCVPSTSESFGLAYIEAAACGTPSVGYQPAIDEISTRMGSRMGVGVRGDQVTAALAEVLAVDWDRDDLRARTVDVFSRRRMGDAYRKLIGKAG